MLKGADIKKSVLKEGLLGRVQDVVTKVTLAIEYEQCEKTGRIEAFKLDWQEGQPDMPHIFWDSDVAKWIEAAAYAISKKRNPELEKMVEYTIDLITSAQGDDGYLNIVFSSYRKDERFVNLRDWHELYCAGHLIEAAVAWKQATGKTKLFDTMCRYADYLVDVFGPNENQIPGYPGHEEAELALVKLYRETGSKSYLQLASFFVNERGSQPHYYDIEAQKRGSEDDRIWGVDTYLGRYAYNQAHKPLKEQTEAVGHSVRALYLYAGAADTAYENDDAVLADALKVLWDNIVNKRMYITGGVGSSHEGERFTFDYDLPNDLAYTETCAAIALAFFADRMMRYHHDSKYTNVLERVVYNGILSGISLAGDKFFYANPLEIYPESITNKTITGGVTAERQEWFGCACCPPNIARFYTSIDNYIYSYDDDSIYINLYAAGCTDFELASAKVTIEQQTDYPWSGDIDINVNADSESPFTIALRIPDWCSDYSLDIEGDIKDVVKTIDKGYLKIKGVYNGNVRIGLKLPMEIRIMESHPAVRHNAGLVAVTRGPIVYCVEEIDNGSKLSDIRIIKDSLSATFELELLGGVTIIKGRAKRTDMSGWQDGLYAPVDEHLIETDITLVPYYTWSNREIGEMRVWLQKA